MACISEERAFRYEGKVSQTCPRLALRACPLQNDRHTGSRGEETGVYVAGRWDGLRKEAGEEESLEETDRISFGLSSSSCRFLPFLRTSSHTKRRISRTPATMPVTAPATTPMLCTSVFSETKAEAK